MKRKKLIKIISANGARFERRGSDHDIYKKGSKSIPVPRHTEIEEGLAKSIIKQSEN